MPPSTKSCKPATRTTRATSTDTRTTVDPSADDLADKLATKLSISDSKAKPRPGTLQTSQQERKAAVMRAVNAASKSLNPRRFGMEDTATSARKDLTTLRNLSPGQVDIERAASSIIAKLVTLEMYHAALGLLQDMRQPLIALYHPAPPPPSAPSPFDLLALPLFDPPLSELHISLTAAMSTLPEKQCDQFFARAYTITSRLALTPAPASSAYSLRIYSLLCLAHTRPSVVSPNTFWEQAVKFTAMFTNTDSVSPEGTAQSVSDSCARLVAAVENRQDCADFMAGVAFARFCKYWSRFTKQAGDLRALKQVGRLVQCGSHESQAEEDRTVIEASALAMSLARALAVFEQLTAEHAPDFASKISEFTVDIKGCGPSLAQSGGDHDQVKRGLERLRRAVVKVVEPFQESKTSFAPEVKSSARALLEQIVDVHCEAITRRDTFSSSTLTPALESLFTLARTSFALNNPDTYTVAHSHLARAAALLSDPPASSSVSQLALASYIRCVAGVYHYLAGQLHQSGRYDHTVRLADEGCRLGQRALQMYHAAKNDASTDVDSESKGKEEAWKLLEEQLYRRWELLAVCHAKPGDRKSAYKAFLNSASAFPFTQHKLVELARTTPSTVLFEVSPALKQLGALVDRVTYIASCELFQGPEAVSALFWFAIGSSTLSKDDVDCVLGAILERQISSLEESKWKQGVQSVLRRLIEDALEVYTAEQRPVRRARVLLKRLELSYHSGLTSTEQNEDATQYHEEAQSLLSRQDFALDGALAQYSSEFSASLHLWLAVHAHRTRDPALAPSVISHTEEACKIIRALVPAPVPRYSVGSRPSLGGTSKAPKNKVVEPAPAESQLPRRMTRGKTAATMRTKAAPRATKAKAPPVTPRRRRALDPVSLNAAVVTPPKAAATVGIQGKIEFDDFSKFIGLIRMVSHLMGLVGHILVRVQLLNAARRLSERHTGVASEVYVSLTIDTAHDGSLSPDVVVVLLLRYSEALAASGEVLKASMTYCDAVAAAADCIVEEKGLPTAQRVRVRAALLERAAQAALSYAAVQDARDDPTSSIEGLMQALRLWNRAIDTLSRLQPSTPTSKQPAEDNPFEVTAKQPEDSSPSIQETRILSPRASKAHVFVDSCGWRLAEGLLSTLLSLSQAYAARGSAREAEFFVQQIKDLAESLHAPVMISRALAQHGELQIQLGQLQEGHQSLMRAAELVMHLKGPDAAEIRRLQGRYNQLSADSKGARQ
ncbi:hypothetical protein BD311DRAFT_835203 [Dichomitus squalens]|uniref:Separin n=1 Tax=Dichomitus squalens TaxID=114155 RepID=A0A4Q9M371_9APHY|nr:hypothetical protein BD311DRAFT_835203 [Dichomitus squalens]